MPRELQLSNQRTGEVVAAHVKVADNPWTRLKGLLGKKGLPDGEALLIRPCSSVHTFFMRFSMDAIFIDRENRVLKVKRDMRPFRVSGARKSHAVIELMGGALRDGEVEVGDQLAVAEASREAAESAT